MITISQFAQWMNATVIGTPTTETMGAPLHLLTDSRRLSFPEQSVFFAIQTRTNDGHRYLHELYNLRVRFFVISSLPEAASERFPEAIFFQVTDTLKALQQVAGQHRRQHHLPVVGITGSNGKTTTKEFLYQLLQPDLHITRSPRSYNSQLGVPLSVWQMGSEHELALIEAGISQPGEMQAITEIIQPDYGVFTGLGSAHQEHFSSLSQKAAEKLQLFTNCRFLVINQDDPLVRQALQQAGLSKIAFSWSRNNPNAPVYLQRATILSAESPEQAQTELRLCLHQQANITLHIPFSDAASIENILHAITLWICLKEDGKLGNPQESTVSFLQDRLDRFERLEAVAMRMEVKQGKNNCLIINDTYNSDLQSLALAMDFQQSRKKAKPLQSTLILSDILQTGIPEQQLYQQVASLAQSKGIQRVIGIGAALTRQKDCFPMPISCFPDTPTFLHAAEIQNFQNELILVKGSRDFHFEEITKRLEKKIHETILEVNLDALIHNFNYYRSQLKPSTKMICMVKAYGYGAGSYELAKTLQDHRCDYLAVAVADEGVELRKEGITLPIIVMNPEFNSFDTLFEYRLEPEIYSFRLLQGLMEAARERGIRQYPIHLKFDTGMHRLGFQPNDTHRLLALLDDTVQVVSAFSHLAGSDSSEFDTFTAQQIQRFRSAAQALEDGLGHPILKHILNSGGIERWNEYQLDMVRLGIGLYGVSASGSAKLRNVSTLKTTILQIQQVPAGDTVGYSRKTRLERNSRIAILPIGYADGLDRHLGNNRGEVWINGQYCPIVGNICMDACMVDVTDTQAHEGDTVLLFGDDLPVSRLAEQLGTIPYEILTSVSPRVKRIYYQE